MLATDIDIGRLRPIVAKIRAGILAGESFAEALSPNIRPLFPAMYVALVRVGEASGTLDQVLEMLAAERQRAEAMRRKLTDATALSGFFCSPPSASCCSLFCSCCRSLPRCCSDFGAKLDPILATFLALSDLLRAQCDPAIFG